MNVLHVLDNSHVGGIQELIFNLHRASVHRHDFWAADGTMAETMRHAGMTLWPGGPPDDLLKSHYYQVCVGHTVGGWSHKDLFTWAKGHGMATVECLHSIHRSPTPPELVDHFVPVSNLAREANPQMGRATVIYAPVCVSEFAGTRGANNRIGKMGRVVAEKSPLEFAEIARALPNYSFALAGDGAQMPELRRKQIPNLELLGMIRDFPSFYASLELYVGPTQDECCSAVVGMAQAAGVPVICQDIPALRETTGGYALFCRNRSEFVEAIRAYYDRGLPELVGMRQRAYEWTLERFDFPVTIAAWDRIVEGLA